MDLYNFITNSNENFMMKKSVIITQEQTELHITYADLKDLSDLICNNLLLLNTSNGQQGVFCILQSSIFLVPLILGILKARMYFIFVNTDDPLQNIKNVAKYVDIRIAVCAESFYPSMEKMSDWKIFKKLVTKVGTLLILHIESLSETLLNRKHNELKLVYIMQTSGTTNTPKIVQVSEMCILPNIKHFKSILQISPDEVIPLLAPLTFDPSIVEIFLTISAGATLLIIPENVKKAPNLLLNALTKFKVNVIQCCPTVLLRMGKQKLRQTLFSKHTSLRLLVLGGETCPSIKTLKECRQVGNRTVFYNVYGTTEVSCWASYYKITFTEENEVPLGKPILETEIDIRDDNGEPVLTENGTGELFIGSKSRLSLINDEKIDDRKNEMVWRSTGDWVEKIKNQIYFRHRIDGSIKHNGKIINLSILNSILDEIEDLDSHHITYYDKSVLMVFAVTENRNVSKMRDTIVNTIRENEDMKIPIQVHFVSEFPITNNGKIDTKLLIKMYETNKKKDIPESHVLNLVLSLWKVYTKIEEIDKSSNFLQYGCDSITAVQFVMDVEWHANQSYPLLVDKLLHSDLKDIINYIKGVNLQQEEIPNPTRNDVPKVTLSTIHEIIVSDCYMTFSRGKSQKNCICGHCWPTISELKKPEKNGKINLELNWRYDLQKCVDSTPLIVQYKSGHSVVFMGSHSGKFVALNTISGEVFWDVIVPDRIESSASLSYDHKHVLFGCYDYNLYCLKVKNGQLKWAFKTEGEIKSIPIADPNKNIVYCCCHDKHLYILNGKNGSLITKIKIAEGSLFSSPCISLKPHFIYIASLDGQLAAVDPIKQCIKNTKCIGKPLFSSPACSDNGVYIGCVDGFLYFINHEGEEIWRHNCVKPIFCSPFINADGNILIGSQDNSVKCIEALTGNLKWSFEADSQIYGTPTTFQHNHEEFTAFASTSGILYVINSNQELISSKKLDGEVFSSPIYYSGYLILGCRDNYVYCFKITELEY